MKDVVKDNLKEVFTFLTILALIVTLGVAIKDYTTSQKELSAVHQELSQVKEDNARLTQTVDNQETLLARQYYTVKDYQKEFPYNFQLTIMDREGKSDKELVKEYLKTFKEDNKADKVEKASNTTK